LRPIGSTPGRAGFKRHNPAFAVGVMFNFANLAMTGLLLTRQRALAAE
jgi:hypothetical protein